MDNSCALVLDRKIIGIKEAPAKEETVAADVEEQ
jgi:hypothetical protein